MSSKITFSIEESLWLNHGHEISEVIAMSLEPDVTIQEMDEHVMIRGNLLLRGEYRPVGVEEMFASDLDFTPQRIASEVNVKPNGIGEVKHYIPIDVTIPLERIENLDDIYVHINSFDYVLPEKSCIQLTAEMTISGMHESNRDVEQTSTETEVTPSLDIEPFQFVEREQPPTVDEEDQHEEEFVSFENDEEQENTIFTAAQSEAEVRSPVVQNQEAEHESTMGEREARSYEEEEINHGDVQTEELSNEREAIAEEAAIELERELAPSASELEERESDDEEAIVFAQEEEKSDEATATVTIVTERNEEDETTSDEQNETEECEVGYSARVDENALYLTTILQNGEERFTKLKMCIIQENESLTTIAERYHLTTSQLIRANGLEEETLQEGQILYIPSS